MPHRPDPCLIAFSGLPGTGKTALARLLAAKLDAVFLRVDRIEAALALSAMKADEVMDGGYQVAAGLAADALSLGQTAIVDAVNPIAQTETSVSSPETCLSRLLAVVSPAD